MKELVFDVDYDIHIVEHELIRETFDDLSYHENNNQPTREIFYKEKMLYDNTPIEIKRNIKINKILNERN